METNEIRVTYLTQLGASKHTVPVGTTVWQFLEARGVQRHDAGKTFYFNYERLSPADGNQPMPLNSSPTSTHVVSWEPSKVAGATEV